jgi:polyisoprenoid-binding protein YceI
MSSQIVPSAGATAELATGGWRLDPSRSSVEFHVRHFYGLITVKGRFDRYNGTLNLTAQPAIELTIEADSLETKNKQRDKHLRSDDFFDVENHPQVRFESAGAALEGEQLKVRGHLHAAGKHIPLDVDATVRELDGGLEIEASALADHRELGMTWSPLGILRAPSRLIVRGRLLRAGGPDVPAAGGAALAGAPSRFARISN